MTATELERQAYGLATHFICDLRGPYDDPKQWFAAYEAIHEWLYGDLEEVPEAIALVGVNALFGWDDILEKIDAEAAIIMSVMTHCLELAGTGLAEEVQQYTDKFTFVPNAMAKYVQRGAHLKGLTADGGRFDA